MADSSDEMYSDADESPSVSSETTSKDSAKEEGEQTGLLPKSFFGSKELTPGKQCKVEIERVFEDEVQVRYIAHKGGDESESPSENAAPDNETEELYADA